MPQTQLHQNQLAELLANSGDEFIAHVYRVLLNREPDWPGLQYYSLRMRTGLTKEDVLVQVARSEEAQINDISVPGLAQLIKKRQRHAILRAAMRKIGVLPRLPPFNFELGAADTDKNTSTSPPHNQTDENSKFDESIFLKDKFDPVWYLSQNPDVMASGLAPELHYLKYGKAEGRSPRFDSDWYLSEYPDVAAAGVDPAEHYIKFGLTEGRYPAFNNDWYLSHYPDVAMSQIPALEHYIRHGRAEGRLPAFSHYARDGNDYKKWVRDYDTLTDGAKNYMEKDSSRFEKNPLISVVMPVYNPNPEWLIQAIESVRNQIYKNWEFCIADDFSTNPSIKKILEDYARIDARIKVIFRQENGHISRATNSALAIATGEWIALLDHDDILPTHALYWVAKEINDNKDALLIYSDEDKINEKGERFGSYFKSDWNQDLFYSHNMFSHLGVYYADLVKSVGGFRVGLEGSQDYDLALRCIERVSSKNIRHIPRVLYHWRVHSESTALSADAKPYAMLAGERAINEHFSRVNIKAKAELIAYGYRVRYELPEILPLVSLIIPTRNGYSLLKRCIDSILAKTTYRPYEVIIVDNGSDDPVCLNYISELSTLQNFKIIRDDGPFNYSRLNNRAVNVAKGSVIGLVNNDIEVISPDWLSEMVSHALRPEVGAVGAKLLYPDDTIQHAGILLGVTGVAAHSHKRLLRHQPGYLGRATLIQSFSAVTAACLLVRKELYGRMGGLNEIDLQVAFNDVDFCIRLRDAGYRNIWTPYAELYHHESATRGYDGSPEKISRFQKEIAYMQKNNNLSWDPAYNPNLTQNKDDFSLAWPPRITPLCNLA